jgi:hypothetical protein
VFLRVANGMIAIAGRSLGVRAFKLALRIDALIAQAFGDYRQLAFVIVKNPSAVRRQRAERVDVDRLLGFRVALHRLGARGVPKP